MTVDAMRCGARTRRILTKVVLVCIVIMLVQLLLRYYMYNDRFAVVHLDVSKWREDAKSFCGRNYTGFGHIFFRMYNAYVLPTQQSVFSIQCRGERLPPNYWFYTDYYAPARYTNQLQYFNELNKQSTDMDVQGQLTLAIHREYPHNFYHAMTQWYNVFLLSKLFHFNFRDVNVLLLDSGPTFHIDAQWKTLFKSVIKIEQIKSPTLFKNIIFNIPGHESPMYYFRQKKMSYVEEFSREFLNVFGLNNDKILDCSNLTVVLAVRRDYFMHPVTDTLGKRNTQRKFKNEMEILTTLRNAFPGGNIRSIAMEDTSLQEQLILMTQADVLIGMHGCALTHTMFLPRHAAVFELYPKYWTRKFFFSSIARWRGVKFDTWINDNSENEYIDHYTYVPPDVIGRYARTVNTYLCGR